jgi:ElaA protein
MQIIRFVAFAMNNYTQIVKHFKDLTPSELYSIMRLRNEVFVVEQDCVYQDADNKDILCHHLMLYDGKDLAAYARLVPAGLSYNEISIGRVVTSPKVRGTGAGKALMKLAIAHCYQIFGKHKIRIGAQVYAKAFYSALGFEETGDIYDEDGIPHIEMIL